MGLAASQCRLLVLTARKSDLEYRAQNITNRKLLLSAQTENIAMDYTRALGNRQMRFVFDFNSNEMEDLNEDLSIGSIYSENSAFIGKYRVTLADGTIAVSNINQLPFALDSELYTKSGGKIIGASASMEAAYSKLTTSEKVAYLASAVSTALKAGATVPESVTSVANKKIKLTDKVTSEGHPLTTRKAYLDTMLDAVMAGKDRSTKPAFAEADWKKLTDAQKAAYKEIIRKIATDGPDEVKSTISATGTDAEYAAAVKKLNDYVVDHSTGDWVKKSIDSTVTKDNVLTDIDAGACKTYQEYLQGLATNYGSSTKTTKEAAAASLSQLLVSDPDLCKTLICNCSAFKTEYAASTEYAYVGTLKTDKNGNIASETTFEYQGEKYIILPSLENNEFFQNALREGSLLLQKFEIASQKEDGSKTGKWTTQNIGAMDVIQDRLYTEDDAKAEAEYETKTAIIQHQDKLLDVELKQIETQQKACENEIESVNKILEKNVEKSFKVFS